MALHGPGSCWQFVSWEEMGSWVGVGGGGSWLPPLPSLLLPALLSLLKPGWPLVHSSLLSVVSTGLLLCASTREVMT